MSGLEPARPPVLREEVAPHGIAVSGLHVGYMDTDMAASVPAGRKIHPATVATPALDGVAAGDAEIIADELTRTVKAGLAA